MINDTNRESTQTVFPQTSSSPHKSEDFWANISQRQGYGSAYERQTGQTVASAIRSATLEKPESRSALTEKEIEDRKRKVLIAVMTMVAPLSASSAFRAKLGGKAFEEFELEILAIFDSISLVGLVGFFVLETFDLRVESMTPDEIGKLLMEALGLRYVVAPAIYQIGLAAVEKVMQIVDKARSEEPVDFSEIRYQ